MVGSSKKLTLRFQKQTISLVVFALLFLAFSILDQTNSRQNRVFDANRSQAHFALICLDLYMVFYIILHMRSFRTIDKTGLLLIGIAVWIFLTDRMNDVPLSGSMVRQTMVIAWALVYFFFKIYCSKNDNYEKQLRRFSFYQYLLFAGIFLYYSITIILQLGRWQVLQCITNIVVLFPWFAILFREEKNFKRVLIVTIALAFLSFKRSVIIAMLAMATIAFFSGEKKNSVKRSTWFVVGLISIVVAYLFIDRLTGGYLSGRFQGENFATGAGRINIYRAGFRDLQERSIVSLIIGKGSIAASSIIGTGLHNDWLEFLFSYGLIGEMLLFALVVSIMKNIRCLVSPKYKLGARMMMAFFFTLSMLSTVFFAYIAFQIFGFFGIIESKSKEQRNIQV